MYVCILAHAYTGSHTCACVQNVQILLPEDVVCTYDLGADESCCSRPLTRSCCTPDAPCIPEDAFGADIGPKSVSRFVAALQDCNCIFWNGPMGKFELPAYANGTEELALGMAAMTKAGAITMIGGATYLPRIRAQPHVASVRPHTCTHSLQALPAHVAHTTSRC